MKILKPRRRHTCWSTVAIRFCVIERLTRGFTGAVLCVMHFMPAGATRSVDENNTMPEVVRSVMDAEL